MEAKANFFLETERLGLVHIHALHKLMQDSGRQRFHLHELPHRFQKLVFAIGAVIVLVTLALQFPNVLFELLLFLVVSLGHFHEAVVGELARYIVLRELLSRVNLKKRFVCLDEDRRTAFESMMYHSSGGDFRYCKSCSSKV